MAQGIRDLNLGVRKETRVLGHLLYNLDDKVVKLLTLPIEGIRMIELNGEVDVSLSNRSSRTAIKGILKGFNLSYVCMS